MKLSDQALDRLRQTLSVPDLTGTRYRLLGVLGEGGMGIVYEAEDTLLDRRVALKVLDTPEPAPDRADRLLREARVLAQLEHPGIVPIHDAGTLPDGSVFYAMKKVQGRRLDEWLEGVPGRPERLRLFLRICEAVAFAHARGVLHRDLKPENVMIGAFGEALVMDWGLAKALGRAEARPLPPPDALTALPAARTVTPLGAVLGTPGFMAPEQARGEVVDARADVFSLGCILKIVLQGTPPDRTLAAIVAQATTETREPRIADVAELGREITRFMDGEPVRADPEGLMRRSLRLLKKHRVAVILVFAYLTARAISLFFGAR
ncbi:MAG: serine/threonine-protein kinase [Thermoanaerobaculia bacterium]